MLFLSATSRYARRMNYTSFHAVRLFLLLSLTALLSTAFAHTSDQTSDQTSQEYPDIVGSWAGGFQVAQYDPIELVFHIAREADGFSATLDIPSQQQRGIQVDRVTLRNGQLFLQVAALQAEFFGGLRMGRNGSTVRRIDGDWAQSGEFVPLTLRPRAPTEQQ